MIRVPFQKLLLLVTRPCRDLCAALLRFLLTKGQESLSYEIQRLGLVSCGENHEEQASFWIADTSEETAKRLGERIDLLTGQSLPIFIQVV